MAVRRQSIDVQVWYNQDKTGPITLSVAAVFDKYSFGEDKRRATHFAKRIKELYRQMEKFPALIPGKRKRA